ncbi:MAG: hypothetical protein WD069_02680, partial [Planctomycetales bacterium]
EQSWKYTTFDPRIRVKTPGDLPRCLILKLFREVFSEAAAVLTESLSSWFDQTMATFGGRDMLDTVRDLVGYCAHFDFEEMSERIPKVDLPALRPFFLAMLALNNRRPQDSEQGLSFKTPESWLTVPAVRSSYTDMVFSRSDESKSDSERVLGFGHAVFHEAVRQARGLQAAVTSIPTTILPAPLVVFRVSEQITSTGATVRSAIAAVEFGPSGESSVLSDWQLVTRLNEILDRRTLRRDPAAIPSGSIPEIEEKVRQSEATIKTDLQRLDVPFVVPEIHLLANLSPTPTENLSEPPGSGGLETRTKHR